MNLLQGETGNRAAEVAVVATAGGGQGSDAGNSVTGETSRAPSPAPGIVYTHELSFESVQVWEERMALESYR